MTQTALPRHDRHGPTLDVARAYRVWDLIQAHPEHLDQALYFSEDALDYCDGGLDSFLDRCGTTACFAGWTLLDAGYVLRCGVIVPPDWDPNDSNPHTAIEDEAAALLGLTYDEHWRLFHCFDHGKLPQVVEEIFGPHPEKASV